MLAEDQYLDALAAELGSLNRRLYLLGVREVDLPDALAETIRALLASRAGFTGETSFSVFCFGVAARVVARRKGRRERATPIAGDAETAARAARPPTSDDETIDLALDRVPYRSRVVLVAVEMQQMSLPDLAHVLGLPATAVPILEARLEGARVVFASALRELEGVGSPSDDG